MGKYLITFSASALLLAGMVNGYASFIADADNLHGFEFGISGFILGMSHWLVVFIGNLIGFSISLHTANVARNQYIRRYRTLLSAGVGALSLLLTIPLLIYMNGIMPLYRLGLLFEIVCWWLVASIISFGLAITGIHYINVHYGYHRRS